MPLTDKGAEKFTADKLKARTEAGNKAVSLSVPAALLTRGDYLIKLSRRSSTGEFQEVGDFPFRVTGD